MLGEKKSMLIYQEYHISKINSKLVRLVFAFAWRD